MNQIKETKLVKYDFNNLIVMSYVPVFGIWIEKGFVTSMVKTFRKAPGPFK